MPVRLLSPLPLSHTTPPLLRPLSPPAPFHPPPPRLSAAPLPLLPRSRSTSSISATSLEAGIEACVEAAPHPAHPKMHAMSAAERWRAAAKASELLLGLRGPGERLCRALRLGRHSYDLPLTRRPTYTLVLLTYLLTHLLP